VQETTTFKLILIKNISLQILKHVRVVRHHMVQKVLELLFTTV